MPHQQRHGTRFFLVRRWMIHMHTSQVCPSQLASIFHPAIGRSVLASRSKPNSPLARATVLDSYQYGTAEGGRGQSPSMHGHDDALLVLAFADSPC